MIRKYFDILPSEGGKGMSKEEILCKHLDAEGTFYDLGKEHGYIDGPITPIFPAMDEYAAQQAKQESIELLRWMTDNVLRAEDGERWKILDSDCNLIVNESQLYDYFTEQRNKQGL